MPTYLYQCLGDCQMEFEQEHSIKDKLTYCPTCQKEIKRLIARDPMTQIDNTNAWTKLTVIGR
jgi:putative FmdB family regulatory protein